jgi:predicted transcriptional regulator
MNRHQKLDSILKYMSQNIGEIPKRPDRIVELANLNYEKSESYMMFIMMLDDGYVYEHTTGVFYGIKYKGIVFLDNGGYTLQHKIYKRKQSAEKISDYVNFLVKPFGIITMILAATFTIIKILEFLGIIHPCIKP